MVVVSVQVAWCAVVGWIGAFWTLLPLAVRGAPLGRSAGPGPAGVVRLLPTATREAVPR